MPKIVFFVGKRTSNLVVLYLGRWVKHRHIPHIALVVVRFFCGFELGESTEIELEATSAVLSFDTVNAHLLQVHKEKPVSTLAMNASATQHRL